MIDAKSVRSNELEIMKSLNGLNVCEERRFYVLYIVFKICKFAFSFFLIAFVYLVRKS